MPPILYALVQGAFFAASSRGPAALKALHFPLEWIGLGCIIASAVIVFRLFPQLSNRGVWAPFAFNALVVLIVLVGLAFIVVKFAF